MYKITTFDAIFRVYANSFKEAIIKVGEYGYSLNDIFQCEVCYE